MRAGRIQPVPAPHRVLQATATHCARGAAGCTPCRFVIGMPIEAPGRQYQIARLQVLLQPVLQALFVLADRAIADAEMKRRVYAIPSSANAAASSARRADRRRSGVHHGSPG